MFLRRWFPLAVLALLPGQAGVALGELRLILAQLSLNAADQIDQTGAIVAVTLVDQAKAPLSGFDPLAQGVYVAHDNSVSMNGCRP